MKKNSIYALMSAIALSGTIGFSSCSSSSDDVVITNPDYNPEENTVKVQIAISLQDNIAGTRMSADAVQSTGTVAKFLGMTNIKLLPYNLSTGTISSTTPILEKTIIGLSEIPASTSGDATEANKVYSNVAVPINTNRFLLYGYAGQTAGFENGDLTVTGLTGTPTDVSGVHFTPVAIADEAATTGSRIFKNLMQLLNRVAKSSVTESSVTTTWAPGANQTTVAALAGLYTSFAKLSVGSSTYVKEALEKIYFAIANDATLAGNSLANKIKSNITDALTYTESSSITCAANTVSGTTLTLSENYQGYPASAHLPEGAPRIAMNSTSGEFEDATEHSIGAVTATALNHYVYPANLQYFVESDILTKDSKVLGASMTSFTDAQGLYGTSPSTSVTSETRSILLNKQIQYGVGRFDTKVNPLSGTKYFDHDGQEVTIPEGGFTLTGVLIGDQRAVDWNFTRSSALSTPYTIYDNKIAGGTAGSAVTATSASAQNYTLVLETLDDASVNIALEFVNNSGKDFEGVDGTVPAGATFYLVGSLTPSSTDTNYGEGVGKTKKVFAQDFVTTATFTIGTGADAGNTSVYGGTPAGFGLAHIGLPDLTMPQMELGLSVDLQWQPGLTFNVVF